MIYSHFQLLYVITYVSSCLEKITDDLVTSLPVECGPGGPESTSLINSVVL